MLALARSLRGLGLCRRFCRDPGRAKLVGAA